jgi:UDP-N-acetylmuramoyl-tripeptide--D-alanyl-D-alanine ligase
VATPIPENQAPFHLDDVLRQTGGTLRKPGTRGQSGRGLTTDSRVVSAGALFLALRGEVHDGHAFLGAADEKGAGVLVVDERADISPVRHGAVVSVPDTLVAWGSLAAAHLEAWRRGGDAGAAAGKPVLTITGSAGKTTTKEMVASLLALRGPVRKTQGNLNNRIGLPATVLTLDATVAFAVLEAGMSLPGEMAELGRIARPDVAAIVNVGLAHAEGVGGREGVAREKGALYQYLRPGGTAVVNVDDAFASGEARRAVEAHVVGFGLGSAAAYRVVSRKAQGTGADLELRTPAGTLNVRSPFVGEAHAVDLACALACAEAVATPFAAEEIEEALGRMQLPGRGSLQVLGDGTWIVDDSYNANPISMRASLAAVREMAGGRRIVAVLGEMRELGAFSATEHEALGAELGHFGVGLLISCGGEMDRAAARAEAAGLPVLRAKDAEDAGKLAMSQVSGKDVVLVKASRGVRAERVIEALVADRSK